MADLPPVNQRTATTSLFGSAAVPDGAHAGLVFDRYGRFWDRSGYELQKPVGPALDRFVDEYNRHEGARRRWLNLVHERQRAVPAGADVEERTVTTDARLAIGLGADHPLENGLTFDRVVGVPYLPGTSLKGLCRAASQILDEDRADEQCRYRYLGSEDSWDPHPDDRSQCGAVCFLDAYPEDPPKLEVDVLTPHYPQYYKATAKGQPSQGPVDWDSPNPVTFLTVAAGARFRIRLLSDIGTDDERKRAFAWTWKELLEGLELLGLGAKTAVGYGLMSVAGQDSEPEDVRGNSALDSEMQEIVAAKPNMGAAVALAEELLKPESRWTDTNSRQAVAQHVRSLMMRNGTWTPEEAHGRRRKRYKRTLEIMRILDEREPD